MRLDLVPPGPDLGRDLWIVSEGFARLGASLKFTLNSCDASIDLILNYSVLRKYNGVKFIKASRNRQLSKFTYSHINICFKDFQ